MTPAACAAVLLATCVPDWAHGWNPDALVRKARDAHRIAWPMAHPVEAIDRITSRAGDPFLLIDAVFKRHDGPQQIDRWDWLAAERAAIARYDADCRVVLAHKAALDAACREFGDGRERAIRDIDDMPRQVRQFCRDAAVKHRANWYYGAKAHHFRWERGANDGLPVLRRAVVGINERFGWKRYELDLLLGWIDLFATYLLPGYLRQVLTFPLALMS